MINYAKFGNDMQIR